MTVLLKMQRVYAAQKMKLTVAADLAAADLLHTHYGDVGNVFTLRYFYNQNGSTLVFEHEGVFVAVPYRVFSDRWREYLHNQCAPQRSNLSTYRAEHQTVSLTAVDANVISSEFTMTQLNDAETWPETQTPPLNWSFDDLRFTAEDTLVLMGYLCDSARDKIIEGHTVH